MGEMQKGEIKEERGAMGRGAERWFGLGKHKIVGGMRRRGGERKKREAEEGRNRGLEERDSFAQFQCANNN